MKTVPASGPSPGAGVGAGVESSLGGRTGNSELSQLASSFLMKSYSSWSKYKSFKCLTSTHFLR